jgi:hypothetical protein
MLPVNRKQPENKSELEEAYNALNQVFLKATQEVVPKKKSKKKKKPKLQIMSDKILTFSSLLFNEFVKECRITRPGIYNVLTFLCSLFCNFESTLFTQFNSCILFSNINCYAPTCADDVALISNNPLELQTMIDIVVDFSKR